MTMENGQSYPKKKPDLDFFIANGINPSYITVHPSYDLSSGLDSAITSFTTIFQEADKPAIPIIFNLAL